MNCKQPNSQEAETPNGLANATGHRKRPAGEAWMLSSPVDLPRASKKGWRSLEIREMNDDNEEEASDSRES
jgi:hypothetical protein